MTEREQWRFQWPDGTWIRWNPQTQSWEKEDQGASRSIAAAPVSPPRSSPGAPAPERPPASSGAGWQPVANRDAIAPPPAAEEPAAPAQAADVAEEPPRPQETTSREADTAVAAPPRSPRPSARDVLPPQREPERPGGSLWPTVVAGAVVGVGVGLLLSAVIR
ncbi:MAG: hypothetical protein KY391_05875 [Actinobacteria bacterium]|nr:hypothetical protein [Actinomycetota bacterium]